MILSSPTSAMHIFKQLPGFYGKRELDRETVSKLKTVLALSTTCLEVLKGFKTDEGERVMREKGS
jgi:hypothetical protein